jgi:hypothetical protein
MYFNQLISISDSNMRVMWNIFKTERGTKCHLDTVPSVLEKDYLVINPEQAVDAFNNYFLELLEKLKLQDVQVDSAISCLVSHSSNQFLIMTVVPVTEAELKSIIFSMKSKHSSGYDGISNKILRFCGHLVSQPLSYIFNKPHSFAVLSDRLNYDKATI